MRKLALAFSFMIIWGCSAVTTHAQTGTDPETIVDKQTDPSGCTPSPTLMCYNGVGPLTESYSDPIPFEYTGTGNLYSMDLILTGAPSGPWECVTDIWTDCGVTFLGGGEVEFELGNDVPAAKLPATCNSNDGIGGTCPGFLSTDESATVTVMPTVAFTPEPGSMILFGTGLISILGATKRRFRTQR